jgi:hypothetical protein
MKKRGAIEAIQGLKLEGGSGMEVVDAGWLAGRIFFFGRAGFVNLKPYPNRCSRRCRCGGREQEYRGCFPRETGR